MNDIDNMDINFFFDLMDNKEVDKKGDDRMSGIDFFNSI